MSKPKRPTHYGSTRVARATRNRAAWEESVRAADTKREEAASAHERVTELMMEVAAEARANGREMAAEAMERRAETKEATARDRRQGGLGPIAQRR